MHVAEKKWTERILRLLSPISASVFIIPLMDEPIRAIVKGGG
jgi:hypothetical protein